MALPDLNDRLGIRDRAMLEMLYSTAMRRPELTRLNLHDVDHGGAVMAVRQGKGRKDRVIPIGARAREWVEVYREEARPDLVGGRDHGMLFLTSRRGLHGRAALDPGRGLYHRRRSGQGRRLPPVPSHDGDLDAGERGRHQVHPGNAGPTRACRRRRSTPTSRSASCTTSTPPPIRGRASRPTNWPPCARRWPQAPRPTTRPDRPPHHPLSQPLPAPFRACESSWPRSLKIKSACARAGSSAPPKPPQGPNRRSGQTSPM